jgi:2-amino-4-hydroxy-6-hydroxymethyldihydropteridine diphosphokinase
VNAKDPDPSVIAHVALGSSLGDRARLLDAAVERLDRTPGVQVLRRSRRYDTAPAGGEARERFLNAVVEVAAAVGPAELLRICKAIERDLGRLPGARWADRPIDLDVVLWGEEIVEQPDLVVPHPELHRRRFVLAPLCDLVPEARHPRLGRTMAELLTALGDPDPGECLVSGE